MMILILALIAVFLVFTHFTNEYLDNSLEEADAGKQSDQWVVTKYLQRIGVVA